MNDITKIVGIALLAAVFSVGAFFLGTLRAPTPSATDNSPKAGSVTGSDMPFPCIRWGLGTGAYECVVRVVMTLATTTPCAIQAPTVGSSTLVAFFADFQTASTSQVSLARSATAYASTSLIGSMMSITNLDQSVFIASTTYSGSNTSFNPGLMSTSSDTDFGVHPPRPLSWAVLTMPGATTTNSPVGYCTAVFRVI